MSCVTLTLGRDGMGENADEADFDAWVSYVCERIDEASGFEVAVDVRGERDVQSDSVSPRGSVEAHVVKACVQDLWNRFCADVDAWPKR